MNVWESDEVELLLVSFGREYQVAVKTVGEYLGLDYLSELRTKRPDGLNPHTLYSKDKKFIDMKEFLAYAAENGKRFQFGTMF